MVDVFRLNIDALKENYLPLARFFENLNENTGNESSVILETSKSGMPNFRVKKENILFLFIARMIPELKR